MIATDTQPLLADTEANLHPDHPAAHSQEHLCTRCSSELGTRASKETKITYRLVLILGNVHTHLLRWS
jgi:hypothetical protein